MGKKNLFRTSFFGGFNKKDVELYVKTLEDELEQKQFNSKGLTQEEKAIIDESIFEIKNLKLEREEMEAHIHKLEEELKKKTDNEQSIEEENVDFDAIKDAELTKLREENKLLKERLSKISEAEDSNEIVRRVLTDARIYAKEIVEKAEKQVEYRKEKAREELRIQLENKVIEFLSMNYQLTDFSQKINLICGQLQGVSNAIQDLHKQIPDNVEAILEKTDQVTESLELTGVKGIFEEGAEDNKGEKRIN